jgi:hypothetical protein
MCQDLHQPVSTFGWLFQALPRAEFLPLRSVLTAQEKGAIVRAKLAGKQQSACQVLCLAGMGAKS